MSLIFLLLCVLIHSGHQAELQLSPDDAEMTVNELFMNPDESLINVVENDDVNGLDMTFYFIKEVPCNILITLQVLQYALGDYTVQTGINMREPIKTFFNDDTVVGPILRAMNMTICPYEVGIYKAENFKYNEDNIPKKFPVGSYLAMVSLVTPDNIEIVETKLYVTVHEAY